MTQRRLRPSQGGKFHDPVGPSLTMAAIIRGEPLTANKPLGPPNVRDAIGQVIVNFTLSMVPFAEAVEHASKAIAALAPGSSPEAIMQRIIDENDDVDTGHQ